MTDFQFPAVGVDVYIGDYIHERGITDVLHFTTNKGGLGIFATGMILSRDRLDASKYLEHIYTPNCASRVKDSAWTDYVNLSISRVNNSMFATSNRWHSTEDLWWIVLALDTAVLADPGVYFVTTNNTYTNCLKRGTGFESLKALFAPSVEWGHYGARRTRRPDVPDSWPTDSQAEVLYPSQVPLTHLRAVYVRQPEHSDVVQSWFPIFPNVPRVPVEYKPEVFL